MKSHYAFNGSRQIQSFSLSALLTGAHYEFHKNTAEQMKEATPAALHVEELYAKYTANLEKQLKYLVQSRKLPNTHLLSVLDQKRDGLLRHLLRSIKALLRNPDPEMQADGQKAWQLLSPYEGIAGYEMEKQTGWTDSLLKAIDDNRLEKIVEQYAGSQILDRLAAANNDFKEAMDERWNEMAAHEKADMRALVKEANEIYREMRLRINAFALTKPTQAIDAFIDKHNAMIDNFRQIISGMRRGGSGNESLPKEE